MGESPVLLHRHSRESGNPRGVEDVGSCGVALLFTRTRYEFVLEQMLRFATIRRILQMDYFLRSSEKCQVRRVQKIEGAIFYGAVETTHRL